MTKLNRILFCTSPLQIINTRSAMNLLGKNNIYNDYIIITHPILSNHVKNIIIRLSLQMGFKKVIDLSYLINKNNANDPQLSLIKKIVNIKRLFINKIKKLNNLSNEISNLINKEIGPISSIFFRVNCNNDDAIFINSLIDCDKYGIEDGLVDYIPNNWPFKYCNFYEIKHMVQTKLFSNLYFIIGCLLTRRLSLCKKYFLQPNYKLIDRFTNLPTNYSKCVSTYFKENIKTLGSLSSDNPDLKVVIVGTLIDSRFGYSVDDEIRLYNKLILLIRKKYNINKNEIWYKPHPRIDYKSWLKKKNNLDCSVFGHDDVNIIDISLYNKSIKAVYSVASTSLLYAKKIFNLDSYWIDIRSKQVHPSAYEKVSYLSKRYNIESLSIS